jgi:hypothetical protein
MVSGCLNSLTSPRTGISFAELTRFGALFLFFVQGNTLNSIFQMQEAEKGFDTLIA